MKPFIYFLCCILCLCSCHPNTTHDDSTPAEYLTKPFVHPGMAQSQQDLDYMRNQILSGAEAWTTAFENLKAATSLQFQPQPFYEISVGPYGSNSIGGKEFTASAEAAYNHALMWYITRDKRYAQKAIEILGAWSKVLRSFDANDAKLNVGLRGYYFLNAAEILKHTDAGWLPEDERRFTQMVLTVFYPTIKDFFTEANGNWDASIISTLMCIGVFTDNHDIFNRAVERFYRGERNSGITKYLYPGGQCQETTRDWDHVQLGIGEMAKAAQTAWTQGLDFYSVADDRLAQGFEYTARFLSGDSIQSFGTYSLRFRDRFKDIYESIYHHYKDVKGIRLPYTEKVIEEHTRRQSSVGFLTGAKARSETNDAPLADYRPFTDFLKPTTTGATQVLPDQLPADGLRVRAGQSIQQAIDAARGTGRWIVLQAGVHTLDAPLKLYSGTHITGEGRSTIVFPKAGLSTAMINGEPCVDDVCISNLLIEGATTVTEGTDPNDGRRRRMYMLAPSREGIVLKSEQEGGISQVNLTHVTVQNFTKSGVAIVGGRDITIARCDFSDNGGSVVPGAGFHHNLHLSYVSGCRIDSSRFDTSPFGNGINLTFCNDVSIDRCETARNHLSGIRCAESHHISIADNLSEGNEQHGIFIEKQMNACTGISLRNNTVQNNTLQGIASATAIGPVVEGNRSLHNGEEPL